MPVTKSVQPKLVAQLLNKISLIYILSLYEKLKLIHEEPHSRVCSLLPSWYR